MRDFTSLSAEITDPKIKQKLATEADLRRAELAVDCLDAELSEAMQARKELPAIKAEIESLRAVVARPLNVTAAAPVAAKAKTVQRPATIIDTLITGVACELARRVKHAKYVDTIREHHPDKDQVTQRHVVSQMLKGGTGVATTTDPSWAAELVQHDTQGFWSRMAGLSIAGELVNRGLVMPLAFGQNGSITIPQRGQLDEGSMRPSWVQEGATIPTVQGYLSSTTMARFKLAAISVFSDQLMETSVPNIRSIIERFILQDGATAIDEKLLSEDAVQVGIAPAGLFADVTGLTPGATPADDIKNLLTVMANYRAKTPVFICDETVWLGLLMWTDDLGQTPYKAELMDKGTLLGIPLIHSVNAPAGRLSIMDGASVFMALSVPTIDVSNSAAIVMVSAEGADPSMASAAGEHTVDEGSSINISDAATTIPASEVRSMFQTQASAIRVIHSDLSWARLSVDSAAFVQVTW